MRKVLQLAAIVAITACGSALAQADHSLPGTAPSKGPAPADTPTTPAAASASEFARLDKDKDGVISKKEAASDKAVRAQWAMLDGNKDGKLDQAEFARFEATPSEPMK